MRPLRQLHSYRPNQSAEIAITTFDRINLFERNIIKTKALIHATPGMSLGQNTNWAQIFIRSTDTNNIFPDSETSSTVHYNGVYMSHPPCV